MVPTTSPVTGWRSQGRGPTGALCPDKGMAPVLAIGGKVARRTQSPEFAEPHQEYATSSPSG
jgi:hypothetical protein